VSALVILFFVIALMFLGVFEIGTRLTGLGQFTPQRPGVFASFWTGVLATVVATPCTAPFMGTAIGAALQLSFWGGMVIFTGLGLGLALPMIVLAAVPALLAWLPRPGAWMETLKQLLAFPLLASAIWLLSVLYDQSGIGAVLWMLAILLGVAFGIWLAGKISSRTVRNGVLGVVVILVGAGVLMVNRLTIPSNDLHIQWQPYSPSALEMGLAQNRPVFVNATASWCLTCQLNERVAFKNKSVIAYFKTRNIVALKADWTRYDPEITQLLAKYGRQGVPFYVYYDAAHPQGVILPELLTPDRLIAILSGK
jgi:thiol:disulfide interchange protein DsbD